MRIESFFTLEKDLNLKELTDSKQDSTEIIEFCGLSFSLSNDNNTVLFLRYSEKVTTRHKEHQASIVNYL